MELELKRKQQHIDYLLYFDSLNTEKSVFLHTFRMIKPVTKTQRMAKAVCSRLISPIYRHSVAISQVY